MKYDITLNDIQEMVMESVRKVMVESTMDEYGAYHASLADFKDEGFNLKYLGSGEGSQQYGYGIYVTDNIDSAKFFGPMFAYQKHFKDMRLKRTINTDNERHIKIVKEIFSTADYNLKKHISTFEQEKERIINSLTRYAFPQKFIDDVASATNIDELHAIANRHKVHATKDINQYLYTVEIPEGPYIYWGETNFEVNKKIYDYLVSKFDFLNFNLEPNKLKRLLSRFGTMFEVLRGFKDGRRATPEDNQRQMLLSKALQEMGYKGIKVDIGEQHGGDGIGFNYVIFDANDIEIKRMDNINDPNMTYEE